MRLILASLTILLLAAVGFIILAVRGGAQQAAPRTVNTYAAGIIQINSTTSGKHAFTTALPSTAGCAAGPLSDITRMSSLGWQVATTTSDITITLSRAGTGRFWFLCFTPVN
jgi:hypothetical protein